MSEQTGPAEYAANQASEKTIGKVCTGTCEALATARRELETVKAGRDQWKGKAESLDAQGYEAALAADQGSPAIVTLPQDQQDLPAGVVDAVNDHFDELVNAAPDQGRETPAAIAERPIVFWDCNDDAETLHYESIDDAVEIYLDGLDSLRDAPEKIKVFGYARMEVEPEHYYDDVLENFLERLDENYRADDNFTEPNDEMKGAEKRFVDTIIDLYEPWACEIIKTEIVDRDEWVREHRPDWLTPPPIVEVPKGGEFDPGREIGGTD